MSAGGERRLKWAEAHPAEDHILLLQVACRGKVPIKSLYELKYDATDEFVFPESTRKKFNERRQIHIRSIWERGQRPPAPNLQHLAKFKACKLISDILAHARTEEYIDEPKMASQASASRKRGKSKTPPRDRRLEGRSPLRLTHGDDDDEESLDDSYHNPPSVTASATKSEKEKLVQYLPVGNKINGKRVVRLNRGSNTDLDMIVGVNSAGRTSDNGMKKHMTLFFIEQIMNPNDRFHVRASSSKLLHAF